MRGFAGELKRLREKGLLRKPVYIEPARNGKILIDGQGFINFSSNDYLGLSGHPALAAALRAAVGRYGFGSGASRLLSGSFIAHKNLEEKLAVFKKNEAALVFNSGYSANTGIIPVLAGAGDTVFSDELNHASVIDGIRLSKAGVRIYGHRDAGHLEKLLKKSSGKRLIITETVFSMDGDIAPLEDIVFLAGKYDAMLMIDDAHGTGVLGETGRGGLEHFGISPGGIIQMGTLGKAFGCFGGFVAGQKTLINLLISRARSFIYSTSLPPLAAAACAKAIDMVDAGYHALGEKLWKNRNSVYAGIKELGYDTLCSETPIIPVLAGDSRNAVKMGRYLYRGGIFAPAIRPPTVPEGKCRIRLSVTASHTSEDISRLLEALKKFKSINR